MFYEIDPANLKNRPEALRHDPFKAIIVPRPIGWISTWSKDRVPNLAPFSFFNGVAGDPPMVMFGCGAKPDRSDKDSLVNCRDTGVFVCNMVTEAMTDAMNRSSITTDPTFDEFDYAGLTIEDAQCVDAPRVAECPVHMECNVHDIVSLPRSSFDTENFMVIGQVKGIHIDDEVITENGLLDTRKLRPLARLGYLDYTVVDNIFQLGRPDGRSS